MSKLTSAFLGVAHIHTPDFIKRVNARPSDITIKTVYDRDEARGKNAATALGGAKFAADPQEIFADPEIDSVIVCSETLFHRELIVPAAEAGKHIFCEKPLAITEADANVIAAAVNASNVTFQIGFFQRGNSSSQFIKQEVQAGNLGKITRVRYSNAHQAALDGWFDTDWRWLADKTLAGGGAFIDMGAHVLDLVLSTFIKTEGDVVRTAASFGNKGGRYGSEIDEYGTGLLTFQSGASAVIEASWVDPKLRSDTEVFGTLGQIQVKADGLYYYSSLVPGADGESPVTDLPPQAPHAFELFIDALLGKEVPIPLISVDEAALESILMEKLYLSAT